MAESSNLLIKLGIPNTGDGRSTPDLSFDADPHTGVSVYDSTQCQGYSGWLIFGGTSVSAPALAGLINRAGSFAPDSFTELTAIYSQFNGLDFGVKFRDITSGTSSNPFFGNVFNAGPGWDFVTGVGSSVGLSGK